MKTKKCIKCEDNKLLSEFPKNKAVKDGYENLCKNCKKEYNKQYYQENKKELNLKVKQWAKLYPEKIKQHKKKWEENNPDKIKEKRKKWYKNNSDYNKQYYQENKKELNQNKNEYQKNRKKNDINYKILCNLRGRTYKVLKGIIKLDTTLNLIGCPIEFLRKHLEKQFYNKMTWANYGLYWEMDHIVPCSLFDFTKEEEQRKCFHWTNLQPLTVKDNRKKFNKTV